MSKSKFKMLPIAFSIAAMSSGAVWAADAATTPTAAPSSGIEEVIITARKVEESAQTVPVSVAALSAKDLQNNVVLSIADLQTSETGLFIAPNSQGGAPTFAIRGAKEDNGTRNKITVYIDDVPMYSTLSAANMIYDLSAVETLKGPQGTLQGSSSTGGAIIFHPNKPTDVFEGYAEVGGGNFNRQQFQGMINIPFTDVVQLRIAGEAVRRDGFEKNLSPSRFTPSRMDDDKHESLRATLRIKPSTNFTNDLMGDYYHKDQQPNQAIPVAYQGPFAGGYTLYDPKSRTVNLDAAANGKPGGAPNGCGATGLCTPTWDKATTWGLADTARYEINDNVSIKNILAYRSDKTDSFENNSGNQYTIVNGRTTHDLDQWTEELALHIDSEDKRMRSQAGTFFEQQKDLTGNSYNLLWFPGISFATLPFLPASGATPQLSNNWYGREFKSHAIYGQTSYDLTKELTATLGLRYSWDSGTYKIQTHYIHGGGAGVNTNGGISPAQLDVTGDPNQGGLASCRLQSLNSYKSPDPSSCTAHQDESSKAPSYNFTLEDKFAEHAMIYAAMRGGYIAGGFNNNVPNPANQTFAPEKVNDFEFGVKADWELMGRPIRTNFDVFYGEYSNMQTAQNGADPNTGATYIAVFNAGSATFNGTDLEIKYNPVDNLDLNLAWTHLSARYTNFCGPAPISGQACIPLSDHVLAQVPSETVSLSATVRWPVSSDVGLLSSSLSYFWRSATISHDVPTINALTGVGPTQFDNIPAFDLVNFTTEWKGIMGSKFDANFWVKNLFDKLYPVYGSNQMLSFGYATYTYGDPRTLGLNVRYNF